MDDHGRPYTVVDQDKNVLNNIITGMIFVVQPTEKMTVIGMEISITFLDTKFCLEKNKEKLY